MGIRNRSKELLDRLNCKTLEDRFRRELCQGLNCSPFEAEAVLQVVEEVFFPILDQHQPELPPGRISLVLVAADEPAGKPVADCQKQSVCLTVHRGGQDDVIIEKEGTAAFRQARIPDLCQEALSQGGLLTCEDLAYRIFFVSTRTITRDLATLRNDPSQGPIPLRSIKHDIGPVLTHRVEIVRLSLEGKTTSQICRIVHHSPQAVSNYLGTFSRVAQLQQNGMQVGQIAFLLRRGKRLIEQYLQLLVECRKDNNMTYHLEELLRLGKCGGEKKVHREEVN
jgi:hypothetical protein